MFDIISDKIADGFVKTNAIKAEDKEIYQFGIQQTFVILLNIITAAILGIAFHKFWNMVVFMAAFIPIRIYAGGFHAKTSLRCYIYSIFFLAAVLLAMRFVDLTNLIYCLLYCLSSIIILCLAPIADINKPLDKTEKIVYKKRTVILWVTETVVIFICYFFSWSIIFESCIYSLFSTAIMLILGIIKNKYNIGRT